MSFKNFFSKTEKTIDDVIFSVSVSKRKLRSRPVLVSEKFCGLGLRRVGLDYSPGPGHSGTVGNPMSLGQANVVNKTVPVFRIGFKLHTRARYIDTKKSKNFYEVLDWPN